MILHSRHMAVSLPIKRMSRADKLRAMEALWADLSRAEAAIESPDWHGAVLRETEQLVRDGKAKFSNWHDFGPWTEWLASRSAHGGSAAASDPRWRGS